jgi:hypothetical protein
MPSTALAITTTRGASASQAARANALAARFSDAGVVARVVARAGLDRIKADVGTDVVYIVGRDHDAVVVGDNNNAPAFVQRGMLRMKLQEGTRHPLVRALLGSPPSAGSTHQGRTLRVLDLTAGLGGDAVHVAAAAIAAGVDVSVCAVEGSVVVHALLEEGLPRLCHDDEAGAGAARVRLWPSAADHRDVVDGAAAASEEYDVVYMDPMMRVPLRATPSFSVLHRFACTTPITEALIVSALRVAPRVVLKHGKDHDAPCDMRPFAPRQVFGAHVVYQVIERRP